MKTTLTSIFSVLALPLLAQVTIDQSSFPRPAGHTEAGLKGEISGVVVPTEGTGQTWDYSALTSIGTFQSDWIDATGDADFPTALNYENQDYTFAGYARTGREYEALDADGWYIEGRFLDDTAHSITSVTGGPNDELAFPEEVQDFIGRVNYLDFPVAFGNTWTQTHTEVTTFQLTVAGFGLNNTPGTQKRIHSQTRTVVGEGTLIIPDENGNPSGELDALVIKVENITDQDSVFLGGQPAPTALLTAFGQTQGEVTEYGDFYVFYTPNFPSTVLNINLNTSGNISSVYYKPAAAALATSIADKPSFNAWKTYPNPIAAGQVMNIDLSSNTNATTVELIDLTGRQVFFASVSASAGTARIALPTDLVTGIYTMVVRGADAEALTTNKLMVK